MAIRGQADRASSPAPPRRSVGRRRGADADGVRPVWLLLAVLGVTLLTHAGALDNTFHYDDVHSVVDNVHLRDLGAAADFFTDPTTFSARPERAMYRPLVVLSYAVQHALGATTAGEYLRLNLAAHLLCTALLFGLARVLGLTAWAAAAGAALFGLHPVNAEVANYVSSRSESLAAAGVLAAAVAYLRWRQSDRIGWAVGAVVAGAAGLLAKATAVMLPAWQAWLEVTTGPGRRWWRPLPAVAVAAIYVQFVSEFLGRAVGEPVRPLTQQLWTQLKAGPYYAYLLAMPARLTVEHPFAVAPSPVAATVLCAAALLVSLGICITRGPRLSRTLIGWAALALAPASLVPLNVLVNEHRLYLPSAALALAAAAGLGAVVRRLGPVRPGAIAGPMLAVAVVLAVLAHQRSSVWDTELTLWREAVTRAPQAYRAHLHLGGALEAAGDPAGALTAFEAAARLAPQMPETHYNLGRVLLAAGDTTAARQAWERSLQRGPDFVDARYNLAALLQDRRDWAAARAQLRAVLDRDPSAAEAWRRLGVLERQAGRPEAARAAYLRALELAPDQVAAHYNLGNLEFELGRPRAAVEHYQRALDLDPGHVDAAYNLADTWLRLGDAGAAEAVCRRVLGGDHGLRPPPGLSKLLLPLAWALEAQARHDEAAAVYRQLLQSGAVQGADAEALRRHIDQLRGS